MLGSIYAMIGVALTLGGWRDEQRWEPLHDVMIETMVRLEHAFRPRVADLRVV